ncbi:MAG: hypothetical protein JWO78_204 [Micavibrio sp.]|nr:hypothetical protein [Micavibrio sp.]
MAPQDEVLDRDDIRGQRAKLIAEKADASAADKEDEVNTVLPEDPEKMTRQQMIDFLVNKSAEFARLQSDEALKDAVIRILGDQKPNDEKDDADKKGAQEGNATDAAISLAAAEGVDLTTLTGTGRDGIITKGDVETHLKAKA